MQQPTELEKRKEALFARAQKMLTEALFTTKFGTCCMCCSGQMEGDEQDHSFVHNPYCPILLISDFCRLGE